MMVSCHHGADQASYDLLLSMELGKFNALVAQANHVLGPALGLANTFSHEINMAILRDKGGQFGKPSYQCVHQVEQYLRAAATQVGRKEANPPKGPFAPPAPEPYVNRARIAAIEAIKGSKFDYAKLAQLCKELNAAHASDSHYSVGMLGRSITDHVPPVFGLRNFTEVASNYAGTNSFKRSMGHLDRSLRSIADQFLHGQIRGRETLPTVQQVDFRQDLDVLLGEVVRIAEPAKV